MAQQPLTQNWAKGETEPGLILPQLSCKLFPVLKPTDEAATKTLLPNIFICGDMMQINHQPASPVFCSKRVVHELLDFPQPCQIKLSPASTELDEVMKFRTKADFVGLVNERLISTLSGNLADMQQLARRDAVSVLAAGNPPTCPSSPS